MKRKTQIIMEEAPSDPKHLVTLEYINGKFSAFDYQPDAWNIQVDATLDPGGTPVNGARYIITNPGALHANFRTINKNLDGTTGTLEANDIVQFVSSANEFRIAFDVSVLGEGALIWNRATKNTFKYDGTSWSDLHAKAGHVKEFNNTTDWSGSSAPYSIAIAAATHGMGSTKGLAISVYEDAGTDNDLVGCDVKVTDNGTVTIYSSVKFAGHVVIK